MDDRELLRECIKTRGELGERMLAAEARVRTLEEAIKALVEAGDLLAADDDYGIAPLEAWAEAKRKAGL